MMDLYWIWLTLVKGLGPVTQKKLLECFDTPEQIYHATENDLQKLTKIPKNTLEQMKNKDYLEKAKRIKEQILCQDIRLLTYDRLEYPDQARKIRDFPLLLYYRGKAPLQPGGVGIVGSRRCTAYGKQVTTEVTQYLVHHKIPVISGMAKGIDGYAHTVCAKAQGYTIAFVAHGANLCYPPEQRSLMEEIIEIGAVITEYPPGTRPRKEYFPRRNALISAWIDKLLVVEASEHSGAIITAKITKQLGKEVYAVPNGIYTEESKGTNRLIRDGANIFLDHEQLLPDQLTNSIGKQPLTNQQKVNKEITPILGDIEKMIYDRLISPRPPEELLDLVQGDFARLLDLLFKMELDGIIQTLPGNLISRV